MVEKCAGLLNSTNYKNNRDRQRYTRLKELYCICLKLSTMLYMQTEQRKELFFSAFLALNTNRRRTLPIPEELFRGHTYFFPLFIGLALVGRNSDKLKGWSGIGDERKKTFLCLLSFAHVCFHFHQPAKSYKACFLWVLWPAFRVREFRVLPRLLTSLLSYLGILLAV